MAATDRRSTPSPIVTAFALAVLITSLFASHHSALAQSADPSFWQTDGGVNALAVDDNTLYLGGTFSFVGPWTGGGVPVDPTTAAAAGPFARVQGTVYAAAPDGAGGFYVGGDFDRVGGLPRANLARVHANGTVDAWNPGSDGIVRALALSGALLYVGGDFSQVEGKSRARLAAVDIATGVASSWNPSANASVYALVVQGTNVYAAGEFTDVKGSARVSLAEIRTTNGNPTAWAPNPNGPVYALESDGTTLWAGGLFSTADGVARANLAAFAFATGALTAWEPAAVGRVDDLHRGGTTMYVGGAITSLGGQARGRLGAVDATSGALLPFDGAANHDVYAILAQGGTVYAGGKFSAIGGQPRTFLAALDAATGAATGWMPSLEATVRVLAPQGANVYAGGAFRLLGGVPRKGLAAFDLTTKEATEWNPGVVGSVSSFAVGGGKLFVGGFFSTIAGQSRSMLAAFDLQDGMLSTWDAQVGPWTYWFDEAPTTVPPRVNSLGFVDGVLVVGGTFGSIGGQFRQHIGVVDATTALATEWNPGIQNVNAIPQCFVVNADADAIFIGGRFSQTAGEPRLNIAGLDPESGGATTSSHDPNGDVKALERSGTTVYVGGYYSQFGGLARPGLAAFDAGSGVTLPWNPATTHSTYPLGGFVFALQLDGASLYVGGDFHGLGGSPRSYLGAVDAVSGSLLAWDPSADGKVYDILVDGGRVFVGGDFGKMGGEARRGIAVFDALPVVGVTPGDDVALAPRVLSSAPSPAVAGAFLRFSLPRAMSVSLAMYDASGKHVRTIAERRAFEAGEQRVPLEPGLAPGLYFLRLEADGRLAHGKVVVAG